MNYHKGQVLTHNKYEWYSIRIVERVRNKDEYLCEELHMGNNKCTLHINELKNYH